MPDIIIYHNPRCSKSREALSLLESRNIAPTVCDYQKTPLNAEQIRDLVGKLGIQVKDLLRSKEAEFKSAGLDRADVTDEERIQAMVDQPKLIERPIVVVGDQARIGRPPEAILEILP